MDPRRPRRGVGRIRLGAGGVAVAIGVVAVLVAGAFLFSQPSTGPGTSPAATRGALPSVARSQAAGRSQLPPSGSVEAAPTPSPSPSGEALLSLPIETAPARGPDLTARENRRRGTDRWDLPL